MFVRQMMDATYRKITIDRNLKPITNDKES